MLLMAKAVMGTIMSPAPLPKPDLVSPIRKMARITTAHQIMFTWIF
jgi:hypothetical protein